MTEPTDAPELPAPAWEVHWTAPPVHDAQAVAEGTWSAAEVTPGLFRPVPFVTVAGQELGTAPVGPADSLIVLDGVSVTWGRSEVMDQPTPATGRVRIFDATKTWATSSDRRGQLVTVGYRGTDPATGATVSGVYFRGRIGSPIRVSKRTLVHPITQQKIHGSLVEVPLQSILVDLANTIPTESWPAETLGQRFSRAYTAAGTYAGGMTSAGNMRDYWTTPAVAPVAAADQVSLLDTLQAVYDSSGADRMRYFPDTDSLQYMPRRDYPSSRGLAGLWWDGTDPTLARAGQGVYVRTYSLAPIGTGAAGDPLYLDAATLEYDPADGITSPDRITRVSISHPDSGATPAYSTVTAEARVTDKAGAVIDERAAGIRSARVDSLVAWNNYAAQALADLATMASKEGSQWRLQPLRLRTRKVGGFETVKAGQDLLQGVERLHLFFLQRTWLPEYGIRPVFGVMGGKITYEDGGWDLELEVAPAVTTVAQHAISWSEIDDGSTTYEVQWWDEDHPRGMHESLTYEDLGYCATGLNVTTIPNDQGWDATQ